MQAYLFAQTRDPLRAFSHLGLDFSHPRSRISCGALVGNFLQCMVALRQPKRILEIGTMLGYSALCMASAMPEDAHIDTVERDANHCQRAKENFTRAHMQNRITVHYSEGKDFIVSPQHAHKSWDFVFLDADKLGYATYYEALFPRLTVRGVFIADNALFHGEVGKADASKYGVAIHDFNKKIKADPRIVSSLLPLRDGIQMFVKETP